MSFADAHHSEPCWYFLVGFDTTTEVLNKWQVFESDCVVDYVPDLKDRMSKFIWSGSKIIFQPVVDRDSPTEIAIELSLAVDDGHIASFGVVSEQGRTNGIVAKLKFFDRGIEKRSRFPPLVLTRRRNRTKSDKQRFRFQRRLLF